MSPYTATIFNATISFPPMVLFTPLPAANADALPATLMASDSALVHDMVATLQSNPSPNAIPNPSPNLPPKPYPTPYPLSLLSLPLTPNPQPPNPYPYP